MGGARRIMFQHKAGVKKADRTSNFLQLFNVSVDCRRVCWHHGIFISFLSSHILRKIYTDIELFFTAEYENCNLLVAKRTTNETLQS